MVTRFTTLEQDGPVMSVSDIIEISDAADPKATRRRLMRQFGALLDKLIEGDVGVEQITIFRDQAA